MLGKRRRENQKWLKSICKIARHTQDEIKRLGTKEDQMV
jgi:hypothetical protein